MARSILDDFLPDADEFATHPIHDLDGAGAEAFAISMEVIELMNDEGIDFAAACEKFARQSSLSADEIKTITLDAMPGIDDGSLATAVAVQCTGAEQRRIAR